MDRADNIMPTIWLIVKSALPCNDEYACLDGEHFLGIFPGEIPYLGKYGYLREAPSRRFKSHFAILTSTHQT